MNRARASRNAPALAENHCTAKVARALGDKRLADELEARSRLWVNAFDPVTGLLRDSEFYEGGKWNYSFRLLHDMRARITLAGGDAAFVDMLDAFFGFGAAAVTQPGRRPTPTEMVAGYGLNRFEGLNNEPDVEVPWAYHYAGRPDRTAEIVHAALTWQFGTGAGGLPGNDDSGGLSSWYVWASLGLFPLAGQSLFLVNAPAFGHATLRVDGGEFVVETTGFRETPVGADGIEETPPTQYVQAANEGAAAWPERAQSVGIRVELPFEQDVNAFVNEAFEHRTFFTRLHQFVLTSDAFVVAPGGIGTVLETMMVWQLLQVRHIQEMPLVLVGKMWPGLVEWARGAMLSIDPPLANPEDLAIPRCAADADEAIAIIRVHHEAWLRRRNP